MFTVQVPDTVRCRTWPDGATVILNSATGQWHALNASGSALWEAWRDGNQFESGVDVLRSQNPDVAARLIYDDAGRMLSMLMERGLVDVAPLGTGAAVEMVRSTGSAQPFATTWRRKLLLIAAFACLIVAVVGSRLPFRMICRFVRGLRSFWRGRSLSADRAAVVVAAVQRAARWCPVRSACLEQSLAAVIVAALIHHRLDWCLGAAPDPYRFHAWVEVGGRSVRASGEGASPEQDYCRVLVL